MNSFRVPQVLPRSGTFFDVWADGFLRTHYPEVLAGPSALPVLHMLDILLPREYGINTGVDDLPDGVEGISEPPDRLTIDAKVYQGIVDGNTRARFTGAHEAVHALQHRRQLTNTFESHGGVRLYRRAEVWTPADPEWQANRGAAALLMPARALAALGRRGELYVRTVQEIFEVGFQTATYRVEDARNQKLWIPGG